MFIPKCASCRTHQQGFGTMPGRDQQHMPALTRVSCRRHAQHSFFVLSIWGFAMFQDWQDMTRTSCSTSSVAHDSSVLTSGRRRSLHDLDVQCKDHKSIHYTLDKQCTRVDDPLMLAAQEKKDAMFMGIHMVVKNRLDYFLFYRL